MPLVYRHTIIDIITFVVGGLRSTSCLLPNFIRTKFDQEAWNRQAEIKLDFNFESCAVEERCQTMETTERNAYHVLPKFL